MDQDGEQSRPEFLLRLGCSNIDRDDLDKIQEMQAFALHAREVLHKLPAEQVAAASAQVKKVGTPTRASDSKSTPTDSSLATSSGIKS